MIWVRTVSLFDIKKILEKVYYYLIMCKWDNLLNYYKLLFAKRFNVFYWKNKWFFIDKARLLH